MALRLYMDHGLWEDGKKRKVEETMPVAGNLLNNFIRLDMFVQILKYVGTRKFKNL